MLFPGEQNLTEEAERLAARREIDPSVSFEIPAGTKCTTSKVDWLEHSNFSDAAGCEGSSSNR